MLFKFRIICRQCWLFWNPQIIKENGIMFIATINRTFESYISNSWCGIYFKMANGNPRMNNFRPNEIHERLKVNLENIETDGFNFNCFAKLEKSKFL